MDQLRERIVRAIAQGALLAGATVAATGCSGSDEAPDGQQNNWTITERDMAPDQGQPDQGQPDMDTPCGPTIGTLPSDKYPKGAFGDGRFTGELPPEGAYIVCAPRPFQEMCPFDQGMTPQDVQAHLDSAMGQSSNDCGTTLYSRVGKACGTVPSPLDGDNCCYVIEVSVGRCFEGRPFVIDGLARTSAVVAREGWCDAGEALGQDLTDAERQRVAAAWAQSGLHEHASVASFGKFMMELMSLGAPCELVAQAAQAIQDEIAHARVCFSVASRYAGRALGPDALDITHSVMGAPTLEALVETVIAEGCIGESLSAAQVAAQAAWVADPALKAALTQIADDEAAHAALAWGFVAWAVATDPTLLKTAHNALVRGFVHPSNPSATGLTGEQQRLLAHGVLPAALEAQVRREALRGVVAAAAAALGQITPALAVRDTLPA
jgi:hypothetical protein